MPHPTKTHEDNRLEVCLLCFGKTKTMRPITPGIRKVIEEHFLSGYDPDDSRLPLAVCNTCRLVLGEYDKGVFTRSITLFDYSKLGKLPPPPSTRSSPVCECIVCEVARKKGRSESKIGRQSLSDMSELNANTCMKICGKCFSFLSRGKPHDCTQGSRLENLKQMSSGKLSEQMVASVLREKVRESSLSHVRLSTSIARSLHVDVSPNTSDSKPIKLTTQDLSKIQVDMNFSTNTTLRLAGLIRNSTENRKSVEANTKTKLCKTNHSLMVRTK